MEICFVKLVVRDFPARHVSIQNIMKFGTDRNRYGEIPNHPLAGDGWLGMFPAAMRVVLCFAWVVWDICIAVNMVVDLTLMLCELA